MENRRFRRVQIFWRSATQHPSAKTDHPAATIPDRKHDPIPETIITATAIPTDQHTQLNQLCFGGCRAGQGLAQTIPAGRRVTNGKLFYDFTGQTALFKVTDRLWRIFQLSLKVTGSPFHQLIMIGRNSRSLLMLRLIVRYGQTVQTGQFTDCVGEG